MYSWERKLLEFSVCSDDACNFPRSTQRVISIDNITIYVMNYYVKLKLPGLFVIQIGTRAKISRKSCIVGVIACENRFSSFCFTRGDKNWKSRLLSQSRVWCMVLISLLVEERNEFCGHMEILRCGGQKPGQTDKFRTVRTFQVRAFARTKDVPVFFFLLTSKIYAFNKWIILHYWCSRIIYSNHFVVISLKSKFCIQFNPQVSSCRPVAGVGVGVGGGARAPPECLEI